MFNENYYIEYIRFYEPISNHTVAWITANWDDIIIDGGQTPMSSPEYLARPIVKGQDINAVLFSLGETGYPYPSEWLTQPSVVADIDFLIKDDSYPYMSEWLTELQIQNDVMFFIQENTYPYQNCWLTPINVEIHAVFSVGNSFPFANDTQWIDWSKEGLYLFWFNDWKYFHGLPSPRENEWHDIFIEGSLPYTPLNLGREFPYSVIIDDTILDTLSPTILDRDIYKQQYEEYLENNWKFKGREE